MSDPQLKVKPQMQCPHCTAVVNVGKFCAACGKPISEDARREAGVMAEFDLEQWEKLGQEMKRGFGRYTLADVQFLCSPNNGRLPRMKPLRVEADRPAFFFRSANSAAEKLAPGRYTPEDLFGGEAAATSVEGSEDYNISTFVWVNCSPITVTIALPDWMQLDVATKAAGNHQDKKKIALRKCIDRLSLRTADNLVGGAQVQLRFRVRPDKLDQFLDAVGDHIITSFGPDPGDLKEETDKVNRTAKTDRVPAAQPKRNWLQRQIQGFAVWVGAAEADKKYEHVPRSYYRTHEGKYTLDSFYNRIQMEFVNAVQQAVRGLTAANLIEQKTDARDRVCQDIRAFMERTFAVYGIELLEVNAFEFICPELLAHLRAKGELEMLKLTLTDQKERLALNLRAAAMQSEQKKQLAALELDEDLAAMDNEGKLTVKRYELAEIDQAGRHRLTGKEEDFRRGQEVVETAHVENVLTTKARGLADRDALALEGERNRGLTQIALHQKHLEALAAVEASEKRNRQEQLAALIPSLAGLDPNTQRFLIAGVMGDMQNELAISAQVDSQQEKLERERQVVEQIAAAQGKSVEDAKHIFLALIGQVGNVLAANAKTRTLPPTEPKE